MNTPKNKKILTPVQKKRKRIELVLCAVIVVSMLIVRLVLIDRGTIRTQDSALTNEELLSVLERHEVTINEDGPTGYATILSATPGKRGKADTAVIATGRTVLENFADGTTTVKLPNASPVTGSVLASNEEAGIGIIRCEVEDQDSVYYSSNLYYQMETGTQLYFLDSTESLVPCTVQETDASVDGYTSQMTILQADNLSADDLGTVLCGRGVYSASGYYLGTIETIETDGTAVMASGADVVELVTKNQ